MLRAVRESNKAGIRIVSRVRLRSVSSSGMIAILLTGALTLRADALAGILAGAEELDWVQHTSFNLRYVFLLVLSEILDE